MSSKIQMILMLIFLNISYSQSKFNLNLKKELDSIYIIDQVFREYIDNGTSPQRKHEIANEYIKKVGIGA